MSLVYVSVETVVGLVAFPLSPSVVPLPVLVTAEFSPLVVVVVVVFLSFKSSLTAVESLLLEED